MTVLATPETIDELLTLRDWWRLATSLFTKTGLTYGHGTDNAADEAAFLILSTLDLPIDVLEPWLDCRLTRNERSALADIINQRILTRRPASYLTRSAWIQGRKFYVDERTIVPRSFIGELLCRDHLAAVVGQTEAITHVLELCTGSGCLAILAAEAFPSAHVDALDISRDALEVARRNVDDYRLGERITLLQSDLFTAVPTKLYDLIIANPPYVTAKAVAAFPPEYAAEPRLAHLGGEEGLDLVHRILADAPRFMAPGGALVVEIGEAREALEAARPDLPFLWLDTETSEGEVFALMAENFVPAARQASQRGSRKKRPIK